MAIRSKSCVICILAPLNGDSGRARREERCGLGWSSVKLLIQRVWRVAGLVEGIEPVVPRDLASCLLLLDLWTSSVIFFLDAMSAMAFAG